MAVDMFLKMLPIKGESKDATHKEEIDVLALSAPVDTEIAEVLSRPKFANVISLARRRQFLEALRGMPSGSNPRYA